MEQKLKNFKTKEIKQIKRYKRDWVISLKKNDLFDYKSKSYNYIINL